MAKAPNLVGDSEDIERMIHVQHTIERAIMPFRENTEAAIVIMAMMRIARILLGLYPMNVRRALVEQNEAFFRQDITVEERQQSTLGPNFWVPPGSGSVN